MDQSVRILLQVEILFLYVLTLNCQQHTFFIKPADSLSCPEEINTSQCYDLHTFISEKYKLSAPNTTLLFLPGEHFLELDLNVRNTEEFLMLPCIQSNDSTARISIRCINDSQFIYLQNISFVKVDSISFHSCGVDDDNYGALQLRSVYHSEIINSKWYDSRSSAIFINGSNTVISDCQFMRGKCSCCSGGGIHAENSNVTFTGSNAFEKNDAKLGVGLSLVRSNVLLDGNLTLVSNHVNSDIGIFIDTSDHFGGGMYLKNCVFAATYTSFLMVEYNSAAHGGGLYFENIIANISGTAIIASNSAHSRGGGGIFVESRCYFTGYTLYYNNSCHYGSGGGLCMVRKGYLVIEDANFVQNSASSGGAIYSIWKSFIELGKVNFTNNSAEECGGGIFMFCSCSLNSSGYVNFMGNIASDGGALCVTVYSECIFNNTAVFSGNRAKKYGGSFLLDDKSNVTFLSVVNISASSAGKAGGGFIVRAESSLVMSSEAFIENSHARFYGGAIALNHGVLKMEESSEFTSNHAEYGGAIHAIASKLYFIGDHSFQFNYAEFGGGFYLSDGSFIHKIYLLKTNMQLISNYAYQYGGAIWVEDVTFYTCYNENEPVRRCFFQFPNDFPNNFHFIFDNNTAVLAGSNIYGGNLLNCYPYLSYNVISKKILNSILHFVSESTNSSSISSDPIQVCLCTQYNTPDCSISHHSLEAFSGQQFPLTLVGVGQMNGAVPAVILSHTNPPSNNTVKTTGNKCSTLFYTISSDSPFVELLLYPKSPCNNISTQTLTVSVNIKPCPPGFMLHNETKSCTCDDTMRKLDIQCDINSQSVSHKHRVWVDYYQFNDNNKTIIYHPHCPFDFCTQDLINFTLNSTDNQCRYNRSGFICGACKEGYSLTLGGPKCMQCSNEYLLLFLPLAVAGVVLVFFLLTIRLTVSMGTINGLIFFANIIGTNSSMFLPPESISVLRVFIAWLNLDLGIDTCLFGGLDMYIKVWLQFVFPFYVFLLIGIIIVISHHSTTFTKYLGRDPVAVLATLILLAYTKLFRVVLTIMSFTYIQASDGSTITVWLYDGNVRYLNGKHIPLFMFALLILFFLIVPYTMILLFAPYLQPYSKNRVLFWIDDYRLKSFLHCYYAVIKDKYRSWIGILLVLRLCLLLVFVLNTLGDPSVNIFAIAVVVIFLLCWRVHFGTFYTKWYLDTLELFFIMKLGLFSIAILYVLNSNGNQTALTDTIIGVSFTTFMAIIIYHGWRQLTDSRWYRNTLKPKWQKYFNSSRSNSRIQQEEDEHCEPQPQAPPQVSTTFIDLREPLLDS